MTPGVVHPLWRLLVIAGLVVAAWVAVGLYVALWHVWPYGAKGLGVWLCGFGAGLFLRVGRWERTRVELGQLNARFDAYRKADTATDLDLVGRVTGEQPAAAATFTEIGDDLDVEAWINQTSPTVWGQTLPGWGGQS